MSNQASEILQGDCLELMKDIPDGSVDLILCDPPYGTTQCRWDTIIPFEPLWEQYERVIKDNGAIILTAQHQESVKQGINFYHRQMRKRLVRSQHI